MDGLILPASADLRLNLTYEVRQPRILSLYEQGKAAQWNATTDVDWSAPVDFGAPLPDDSSYAIAAFDSSPLARLGRPAWDSFRWEFQSWMVSQFLHGEQGALVGTARLAELMPDVEAKYFAASQVGDEARHVEAFSRYLREHVATPYPISAPLTALLSDALTDRRWDVVALGLQIMVEALAMAAFRLANATFHDPLIKQITTLVGRDEARHVAFGVLALSDLYRELSDGERAERAEFVLEAAALMRRRFLLEDVWDRIGVDHDEGTAFAAENPMMIAYRQAIFAKVVSSLARIGLMTEQVRDGFGKLDLLGFAASRVTASSR